MATLLTLCILSLNALSGVVSGQSSYVFLNTTASPLGNRMISQHTNVSSKIRCAVLCSSTLPCDHIQYCAHESLCALYELCALCPASSIPCSGGAYPVTAVITDPHPRLADPQACAGHKYLVSGPYGVGDDQLSESSYYYSTTDFVCAQGRSAKSARLNSTYPCSSWSPATDDPSDYVMVDFRAVKLVTGVVMAGRINDPILEPSTFQYVTSFRVLTSLDCVTFTPVLDGDGNEEVFAGCNSVSDVVTHCFNTLLPARCIRINPTSFYGWKSMRFDILGY